MKEGRVINNKASRFQSSNARKFNMYCHVRLSSRRYLTALNQLKQSPDQTRNSNLPQTKQYETLLFSPFLVAVTLITIVTVKTHPTMGKGGRWVKARSRSFPWKA